MSHTNNDFDDFEDGLNDFDIVSCDQGQSPVSDDDDIATQITAIDNACTTDAITPGEHKTDDDATEDDDTPQITPGEHKTDDDDTDDTTEGDTPQLTPVVDTPQLTPVVDTTEDITVGSTIQIGGQTFILAPATQTTQAPKKVTFDTHTAPGAILLPNSDQPGMVRQGYFPRSQTATNTARLLKPGTYAIGNATGDDEKHGDVANVVASLSTLTIAASAPPAPPAPPAPLVQSVFAIIDMSGSMKKYTTEMRIAIRKYITDMKRDLPDTTMLYLWFFNDEYHPIYEGPLKDYKMNFYYMPEGITGLYRTQYHAISKIHEIQASAGGVPRPFIMMIMTDGVNYHESACKAADVVRHHAGNVDIDRSLMVLKGLDGVAMAKELNIPVENVMYLERGQEQAAFKTSAQYTSMRSNQYQDTYCPVGNR